MRGMTRLMLSALAASLLASCGGSTPTAPSGGGAGDMGGGGTPPAGSVVVTVGNIFFRSDRNRSVNQAVDTVVAGGTVTWKWVGTGSVPHNVQSLDAPSFTSGPLETGDGKTYEQAFTTPGTYRYNCAVHGDEMTGVVVVKAP